MGDTPLFKIVLITYQQREAIEIEKLLTRQGFSVIGVPSVKVGMNVFDPPNSGMVILCTPNFDEEEKIFLRKMRNRAGNHFIPFIQMIPSQSTNGGIEPSPLADDIMFLPVSEQELNRKLKFHFQFKNQYPRFGTGPENSFENDQHQLTQLAELLNLNELRKEAWQGKDEKTIIQLYLKKIEKAVLSEACLLFKWNEERNELILEASQTAAEERDKRPRIGADDVFARYWQTNPKPLLMNGVDHNSAVARVIQNAIGMDVDFMIAAPLLVDGSSKGVVMAINKLYRKPFSKTDLVILNLLSHQLSLAIENFNLGVHRKSQERLLSKKEQIAITQLVEEKNFYESVFNSMSAGIMTIDLDGIITFMNRAALYMLNFSSEEILGKKLHLLFREKQSEILLNAPSADDYFSQNQEMIIKTKDDKEIHIGYTGTKLQDREGRLVGTIISFRDIAFIKAQQSELLRLDRLTSLGVLAAGVAHEIRNPLAGIKTMAQGMESELNEGDPKKEYVERIIRQVNRLDDLLKTFFVYAKPAKPNAQQYHIPEIFREVINLVDQRFKDQQITLTTNYEKNLPKVFVDFNQMEQVFFNLILNAVEAMPNGGTLFIDVNRTIAGPSVMDRRKRRLQQNVEGYIKIAVGDTGVGIKPEDIESIFNPFYTTKSYGTGLGLSIVYQIIKEHNGEISVKSEVNKGTKFEILLPVIRPGKGDEVINVV